jgi:hypothetical protein
MKVIELKEVIISSYHFFYFIIFTFTYEMIDQQVFPEGWHHLEVALY